MRGYTYIRSAFVAAGILGIMGSMQPVAAVPLAPAARLMASASTADIVQVRGGRGGAALAAGLATGLIVGGLLSVPHYYDGPYTYYRRSYYPPPYYGPVGYAGPGWEAYCFSRYRSFDPISGTYLGYDGRRHLCQ
ncbi:MULTISPECIES: BA14K family protein [unclassified Tardiphaga]|uniref:BA14K family protein n=1 Tax=unclassified Tardiphaga TaxID=2631404 RepID=UPI001FEFD17C|nr:MULTISPECIES: BA14K family protein [unclassified Tardiphaga]